MKVIKKINNNVAVCLDNHNNELIAFGKGIGFPSMPYEMDDLSKIDRTYYGIDSTYIELINEIPESVFLLTSRIVDIARSYLDCELTANFVFTLADHIHFAIQRTKKNLSYKHSLLPEIDYFYEKEIEMGELAVKLVARELHVVLPKEEVGNIAMHFIQSSSMYQKDDFDSQIEYIIGQIKQIIERKTSVIIEEKDFNYLRFVTHLKYLLKRINKREEFKSENDKLFEHMIIEFPDTYQIALEIKTFLLNEKNWELNQEEIMYLMLHINRLKIREDEKHKGEDGKHGQK